MRIYKMSIIFAFTTFLLLGGIVTLAKKDILDSAVENRRLSQKPEFSKEKLKDGTLFSEFDEYFKDQFIARAAWTKLGTITDMALDKKKYNDVVIGKDGYLLPFNQYFNVTDYNNIENNINFVVNEITELNTYIKSQGGQFIFAGVPTQGFFNKDKYLEYFKNGEEDGKFIEEKYFERLTANGINNINMNPIFSSSGEELYYKTDHHYNFNGAYLTYKEIINKLIDTGVKIDKPLTKEELNLTTIDKPFYGSWNAKLNWLYKTEDKVVIPNIELPKYKKVVEGKEDNRLYYYEEQDECVQYSAYMNGNTSEIKISTDREELPKVLIFGDSFTNAVEPLLFTHFNETRILDLRYYKTKNLYDYIDSYKPDVVIYVSSSDAYALKEGNNIFR